MSEERGIQSIHRTRHDKNGESSGRNAPNKLRAIIPDGRRKSTA